MSAVAGHSLLRSIPPLWGNNQVRFAVCFICFVFPPPEKRRKDEYAGTKVPVINTLLDDESERTTSIVMIRGSRCRLLERGICLRKQAYISYQAPIDFFSTTTYLLCSSSDIFCHYSASILSNHSGCASFASIQCRIAAIVSGVVRQHPPTMMFGPACG